MQPDYPQYPPTQTPEPPYPQPQQPKKRNGRVTAALWLMIGPTALLIGAFILFAIINWATVTFAPAPTPTSDSLFGESNTGSTISSIILFIVGGITALTWLPGLIIGIVLLATRPRTQ